MKRSTVRKRIKREEKALLSETTANSTDKESPRLQSGVLHDAAVNHGEKREK
jgi:hypothetical protein